MECWNVGESEKSEKNQIRFKNIELKNLYSIPLFQIEQYFSLFATFPIFQIGWSFDSFPIFQNSHIHDSFPLFQVEQYFLIASIIPNQQDSRLISNIPKVQ
jgi:hypothetical protein